MVDKFRKFLTILLFFISFGLYSQNSASAWNTPKYQATEVSADKIDNIKLFPNPASEQIAVSTHDGALIQSIRIMNLTGSVIFRKEKINRQKRKIDISDYINGIYSVEVVTEDHIRTIRKIIKR